MDSKNPRVSIGLAVYNGEDFLQEAIDSFLTQTFTDFELIISDNASTDRTAEICKAYAAQDERVRYHRNPTNIGGANNENLTCEMARGQYFRWAAHDDICAPTLLEKCVSVLDKNPDVVLCYSTIIQIDAQGEEIGVVGAVPIMRHICSPDAGGGFRHSSRRGRRSRVARDRFRGWRAA